MNFDKILKFFVPKDNPFFPIFEEDVKNLIAASELLIPLISAENIEKREEVIKQIKALENKGDDITHRIYETLDKTFITPIDRGDIHALASNIDDVLDTINGIGQRFLLYKPKKDFPLFKNMAEVILKAAIEIDVAVKYLKNAGSNKQKILQACINLNTLENQADDIYHEGISKLFAEEKNAHELIKNKAILEILEKCADKAEDISDTIKGILVKMG